MHVVLDNYVWMAGVVTGLINTAPEVWRGDDRLPDSTALAAFVELHLRDVKHEQSRRDELGDLPDLARRARRSDLQSVWELRTTVRVLVDHPDRDSLIAGASVLTSTAGGATLVPDPVHARGTRWAISLRSDATVVDALSLICGAGVLGVVHTLGEGRFRPCGASDCRGAFIDTTRPGRRRYCMPDLCGNRTNVANHRARHAAARGASST